MINLYVSQQKPFGVQSEFPYKLQEEETFAMLKQKIAEKTGVDPAFQVLSIGVPPKYKLSDVGCQDDWAISTLLYDHACLTLEVNEVIEQRSHQAEFSHSLNVSIDESYVPDLQINEIREHIYTVSNFLSHGECQSLIQIGESLGFEELFNTNPNYRTNTRVVVDDEAFAKSLFDRVRHIIPERRDSIDGSSWRAISCNDHFRLCKYVPGQFFSKHEDSYFARTEDEVSFYTVNIYLNEEFENGATRFFDNDSDQPYAKYKPLTGSALIFEHFTESLMHDGEEVQDGVKYLLRTDVMYERMKPEPPPPQADAVQEACI